MGYALGPARIVCLLGHGGFNGAQAALVDETGAEQDEMSFKTTIALMLLTVCGGAFWYFSDRRESVREASQAQAVLREWNDGLDRIEIGRGDHRLILKRTPGGEWSMPGHWPIRKQEVDELLNLLKNLRSRFAPIALSGKDEDLKSYGLAPEQNPLQVTLAQGNQEHRWSFGEEPGTNNRFSRPTYLRVDTDLEISRLAPNLLAALERPRDYYQQRRLFASQRVKDPDTSESIEELTAKAVSTTSTGERYRLQQVGNGWELAEPVRDRVDPDKLKSLLRAVPDIWAEEFVENTKKDLTEYGLAKPEQILQVTGQKGETVTLFLGKQSRSKTRTVTRPAPAGGPMGMPQEPQQEVIHEEYRYAKLRDNDQIFEVKADRLKDVFASPDSLRDERVARFRQDDVRQVAIDYEGQSILLVKDKESWKLQKPFRTEAESSKVAELLDKLAFLQARDKDVIDRGDLKDWGLSPASGSIKIEVEESKGKDDPKSKVSKTFVLAVGKEIREKAKVYLQLAGWQRVNLVDSGWLALAKRPALAYRSRRILNFGASQLSRLQVERGDKQFTLQHEKDGWRIIKPVWVDADGPKVDELTDDLGRLEAVEFVSSNPTANELDRGFGLSKPTCSLRMDFAPTPGGGPAQTLLVGKQRDDKPEYFAKLAGDPAVFVIKKELRDRIDRDSLAYRPLQLWQTSAEKIGEIQVANAGNSQRLKHEGVSWHITEPFQAAAASSQVDSLVNELLRPRAERFVADFAKDLSLYGLERPHARIVVRSESSAQKDMAAMVKEKVLLIGKPADDGDKTRYGMLAGNEGIFVVGEKLAHVADQKALDWLDRNLLTLETGAITRIENQNADRKWTLERRGQSWDADAEGLHFSPDSKALTAMLDLLSKLQAGRFVSYGPKTDLSSVGLDKPVRQLTIDVDSAAGKDKNKTPIHHRLSVGKPVNEQPGDHYARLDDGPAIFVLPASAVRQLGQDYLDFVDHTLFHFDAQAVQKLMCQTGSNSLAIVRSDFGWQINGPLLQKADDATLDNLVRDLSTLRAERVASCPARDLKWFGLDEPATTVTVVQAGEKTPHRVLRLGKAAPKDGRYAMVEGMDIVAIVPSALAVRLMPDPLQFEDRNLAHFADIDRIHLLRGPRHAVFQKLDGTWRMTEPVPAEAEQSAFEDFINALAHLRASRLVAEKPSDLGIYGLDHPQAEWQLQYDGKDVLQLSIGNLEKTTAGKDGGRCYAMLPGRELVFLLDTGVTAKALDEYRHRSAWPTFDASQADSLHYQIGDRSFVLAKSNNDWHVAGMPEIKVRNEAVSETLDALARLRVERFVVDQKADLTLYGLNPPSLQVEVQTAAGKRVLEIGTPEVNSRRFYARVPDASRSDVFVIGEIDAGRIVRDLTVFRQKETPQRK
jgi:hypothetical protein